MATVLAAVDQARVRKPMYSEGGFIEEEAVEPDFYQQTMLTEQVRTTAEAVAMPTAVQIAPFEQTVHVSQVRENE